MSKMNMEAIRYHFCMTELKGTYLERAKAVVDFMKSKDSKHDSDYVCFVKNGWKACFRSICIFKHGLSLEFINDGLYFFVVRLAKLAKIDDFTRKVTEAINIADRRMGTFEEKRNRFIQIFAKDVNLIVGEESKYYDTYYSSACSHKEKRGNTTYDVWMA